MTYKNFGSMKVFTSDILTKKHKFIPIKTLYLRNSCYKLKNNIIQEIITSIIRNDFRNCPNLRKKTENIRFNANNAKKFEGSTFINRFL